MKTLKERHTGIIIGAVLISVLSVGALTYFGLPYVYPYLNVPEKEQTGVLQTVFREFDSIVILHDNIFTYSAINDTNVQITTNGKSQIFVEFHTPCVLTLDPTFTGTVMFVFMLVVEG